MKEYSVHRLSETIIRKSDAEADEIKTEEHGDLNADIYNDDVSNSSKLIFC